MIEVTSEMIEALQQGSGYGGDLSADSAHAGLVAVLAIVERDLASPAMRCQAWLTKDLRCTLHRGHELDTEYAVGTDHLTRAPGGSSVTW